jgi:hypothetical protein
LSDLLGLAERSTHGDDRALVLFDPCLPRGNSLPSFARRSASGREFHDFIFGLVLLPRKTARYVSLVVMRLSLLLVCGLEQKIDVA